MIDSNERYIIILFTVWSAVAIVFLAVLTGPHILHDVGLVNHVAKFEPEPPPVSSKNPVTISALDKRVMGSEKIGLKIRVLNARHHNVTVAPEIICPKASLKNHNVAVQEIAPGQNTTFLYIVKVSEPDSGSYFCTVHVDGIGSVEFRLHVTSMFGRAPQDKGFRCISV